jgi:predicted O-methyltransferase YrrM
MSGQGQSYEKDPRWSAVDTYSLGHLHPTSRTSPSNDVLEHALSNSEEQGKYLQLQARLLKAKNILEVGTLGGYSTIWLANAGPDVKVISVEVDEHHAKVARSNIEHAGVADRVDVRLGPGVEVLPRIVEEVKQGKLGKFQLVFIDADKENNWSYVNTAIELCEPGACIIVDNVVRKGQLAQDSEDPRIAGARRVIEAVGRSRRLDGVVVQTVGDKNYDGFLIAVVN